MNIACNIVATVVIGITAPFTIALHFCTFVCSEILGICMLVYDVWSE